MRLVDPWVIWVVDPELNHSLLHIHVCSPDTCVEETKVFCLDMFYIIALKRSSFGNPLVTWSAQ